MSGSERRTERLRVPRTARYEVRGDAEAAREAWFVLHGYGQLAADMLAACAGLAAPHRLLVAPEALSRFYLRGGRGAVGASWMTREERADEIADQLALLDAIAARELRPAHSPCVLGFSQGVAAACRWVARGAPLARRLVLWAGDVPPDLDLALLRARLPHLRVDLVRGERDEAVGAAVFAEGLRRLQRAGIDALPHVFAGGHELDAQTLARLAGE